MWLYLTCVYIFLWSCDWREQRMDIERAAREAMVSSMLAALFLAFCPSSVNLSLSLSLSLSRSRSLSLPSLYPSLFSHSLSLSLQDPELRHKLRLICEDELPSWLLKDVDEVDQLAFEENEGRLFGYGEEEEEEEVRDWGARCACE